MQDFFGTAQRGVARPGAAALLATLALLSVAVPTAGQSINASGTGNTTDTDPGTPSNAGIGAARVVSCSEVRENPQGEPDRPYRIVRGSCSLSLEDGAILSRVWFKADGERVDITARGAGWTIRNVAITGHGASESPPLNLQVNARNGTGLLTNLWVSDGESNALFVHPNHAGTIRFRGVTFTRLSEDAAYASRPGNPVDSPVGGLDGASGTVGFSQTYVKDVGHGPQTGYGLRLGSDGSYIVNSTIVDTGGPAVANTFAGGAHSRQRSEAFDGVLVRNVDIIQPGGSGVGVRLNNHQDNAKNQRQWTSITTFENVDIEASQPIGSNRAGGEEPIVRGTFGTDADPTPPPLAPRSPERAASGVSGGTGTIGAPVGPGLGGSVVALVGRVAALLVLGALVAVLAIALGLIALLERESGGGGL
jgi:hypothetical protein